MICSPRRSWRRHAALPLCCLALGLLAAIGCGKKTTKATLSGKVTYKKKSGDVVPVTGGVITLHPEGQKGTPYTIPIKSDGTYSVSGVPTGKFKVTVETESVKGASKGYDTKGLKVPAGAVRPEKDPNLPVYVPIPGRYAKPATSPLTWDLDLNTKEKDVELTDQ